MRALIRPMLSVLVLLAFVSIGPGAPWHEAGSVRNEMAGTIASEGGLETARSIVAATSSHCMGGTHGGTTCDHQGVPIVVGMSLSALESGSTSGDAGGTIPPGRDTGPEPGPPRT